MKKSAIKPNGKGGQLKILVYNHSSAEMTYMRTDGEEISTNGQLLVLGKQHFLDMTEFYAGLFGHTVKRTQKTAKTTRVELLPPQKE